MAPCPTAASSATLRTASWDISCVTLPGIGVVAARQHREGIPTGSRWPVFVRHGGRLGGAYDDRTAVDSRPTQDGPASTSPSASSAARVGHGRRPGGRGHTISERPTEPARDVPCHLDRRPRSRTHLGDVHDGPSSRPPSRQLDRAFPPPTRLTRPASLRGRIRGDGFWCHQSIGRVAPIRHRPSASCGITAVTTPPVDGPT